MPVFTPVVKALTPTSKNDVKDVVGTGANTAKSSLMDDWEDVVHPTGSAERNALASGSSGGIDGQMDATLSSSTETLLPAPKRVRISRSMAQCNMS